MGHWAWGIGHGAWGIGHWALGMGHGAWGIGHWALGILPAREVEGWALVNKVDMQV